MPQHRLRICRYRMLARRRYAFCMPLTSGATSVLLLGCRGMSEVYLAQHPRLPRREPLKILSTDRLRGRRLPPAFHCRCGRSGPASASEHRVRQRSWRIQQTAMDLDGLGRPNRRGDPAVGPLSGRRVSRSGSPDNRSDRQRTRLCASAPRSNPQLVRPFRPRWPRKRLHGGHITIQSSSGDGP